MPTGLKLTPFLDWFIPPKYTSDEKTAKKVRLWVAIMIVSLIYSCFAVSQAFIFDIKGMGIAITIAALTGLALIFLLKAGAPFMLVLHISMCNGFANFCFGIYTSGGIFSVVTMWLTIIPMIALMMSNLRNALPYVVAVPVIFTVFYLLQVNGYSAPDFIPKENLPAANLVAISGFSLLLFIIVLNFSRANDKLVLLIENEKKKSDDLLLNILPYEVAEELKEKGYADAKQFDEVTVLFTDFKDFTTLSEKLTPKELVKEINDCFKAFDDICGKYGIEKIKTIGDAYMAAGGLKEVSAANAVDVVNAGIDIRNFISNEMKGKGFEIRIGIHTGPVVAGIVGFKKFAYDIWGDTVNTASRMESLGEVGKINISETTHNIVKDKFTCGYRGKIEVKGKGEIEMYFVEPFA